MSGLGRFKEMAGSRNGFFLWVLGFTLLHGFLICIAFGKTIYQEFALQRTSFTRLCSTKEIITINGQFPGPTIYAHKGDTVIVNFFNKADENVTLHWHGVEQPRNPWYDGPEYITQCPVQPGTSFNYTILLSGEEGTLWWHAHSDWTRATVHGVIIIYPTPDSTYPFSKPHKEVPIVLGSWWKRDVMAVLDDLLKYGGEPNVSDAHTINGQPGDLCPCSKKGTFRMMVEQGKRYMLRVVNAGMNSETFFSIAQHNLTVVGRDGSYIKPLKTNFIMITPGQTMDILVEADQPLGKYYMAARPYASAVGVPYDNTTTTGILQYYGNYNTSSSPSFPYLPPFNDTNAAINFVLGIRSINSKKYPSNVPKHVDTRMEITISVNTLPCSPNNSCEAPNGTRFAASMNNISFQLPKIDILSAYYNHINGSYQKGFPDKPPFFFNFTADELPYNLRTPEVNTRVKVLEFNSSVEIVFQGTNLLAGENHPIHLHGYSFYVLGLGYGIFDREKDPSTYNLVDPPKLNTIGVPKNGWIAMRFRADNPGVWFMHCHLERHNTWGMETTFIVKNGKTPDTQILPAPSYMPPC